MLKKEVTLTVQSKKNLIKYLVEVHPSYYSKATRDIKDTTLVLYPTGFNGDTKAVDLQEFLLDYDYEQDVLIAIIHELNQHIFELEAQHRIRKEQEAE